MEGKGCRRNYEHHGLMTILEEGSLGARTMAVWCIMLADFSVEGLLSSYEFCVMMLDWLKCWPPLISSCEDCIHLTLITFPGVEINTNGLICGDAKVVGMTGGDDDVGVTCGDDNVVALLTCII
ncbi:hypothetical protein V6N11_047759 [Hibiscus sabdariffa]|uniref:Uncharacterized protein n=1 Tax=Hibiscus sabdariffa TaxID=183260 RepID=A0ABR2P7W1_9ROSI